MEINGYAEMATLQPHWTEVITHSVVKKGTCRYQMLQIYHLKTSSENEV